MIEFVNHKDFTLSSSSCYAKWLSAVIVEEQFIEGEVFVVFYTDSQLFDLNIRHLKHDTFTDIITFDYSQGKILSGDLCISFQRVQDNAAIYDVSFSDEIARVMVHGVLHLCGYKDKTKEDQTTMTQKEDYYLSKLRLNI